MAQPSSPCSTKLALFITLVEGIPGVTYNRCLETGILLTPDNASKFVFCFIGMLLATLIASNRLRGIEVSSK